MPYTIQELSGDPKPPVLSRRRIAVQMGGVFFIEGEGAPEQGP